jgi:preprotein translocase subunit SecG
MKFLRKIFAGLHSCIILLFLGCAVSLIGFAVVELFQGLNLAADLSLRERFNSVLETIGLRESHMSAPTRVRRFLSRFMVVIVVSFSIETLVLVFQLSHDNPARLPQAASIGLVAAALLAAWGLFIRLNKSAEEIEPEAMEDAKSEDDRVE